MARYKLVVGAASTVVVAVMVWILAVNHVGYGYVDNSRLLVAFTESARAQKALKAEDETWREKLKVLQDTVVQCTDLITKEYNTASASRKRELQDMLAAANQRANNFRQANVRRMDELQAQKMRDISEKVNVFIAEYGKKHRYSIILGTGSGGTILYGDQAHDITDAVVAGLNERYK